MTGPKLVYRAVLALLMIAVSLNCGGGGGNDGGGGGTVTSVTVTCPETTLPVGLIDTCSASVQGTGSFNSAVTWTMTGGGSVSSSGLVTLPTSAGSVTVNATSVADATKSGSAVITVTNKQSAGFTFRGITHVSWSAGEYSTQAGKDSQDALAAAGYGWAGVLVTWYQANATSTTIQPANNTPSDTDVIAAINELKGKGLHVMLKPHVDALDGVWRGTFDPGASNMDAWFASYTTFITQYARLAQAHGVDMLCIGTEFAKLTGSANQTRWANVISAIRSNYSGPLTYAANATGAGDEFTSVSFWNLVDVIGLDAYFPLTNKNDPTIAELVAAWTSSTANKNGLNIVAAVQNFAGAHPGKLIIFTEIGYRSVAGANKAPYDFSVTGAADNMEQQDCFEAMYKVWSTHTTIMIGNFFWAWPVAAPAPGDTDYNPRGKPAQTVVQNWE